MKNDNNNSELEKLKKAALDQRSRMANEGQTEKQLTLFDIAPWPDSMRALPNDYARSALFTVKNKRQP
ncbi:plasmid replication initiator TrfA, partial [Escherichia coli]|nr:plasmid replication initiator TrfA [Escherichia coli]